MGIGMGGRPDYYREKRRPFAAAPEAVSLGAEASMGRPDSISGRALLGVIAIMTFLAALTLGAVVLVRSAAGEWQSAVAREITIQLRPSADRNIEADVQKGWRWRRPRRESVACAPTVRKSRGGCWS